MTVYIVTDPNASILWRDSTIANDKALLRAIIQKRAGGDEKYWDECVEKIITNIRTEEWQKRFDHRIFVFNVYFAQLAPVVDISFALSCQALDALYFTLSSSKKRARNERNFSNKIVKVCRQIYKKEIPQETANALRIIRNDIMHTGEIMGIPESRKNPDDTDQLADYFKKFNTSTQVLTDVMHVMELAVRFDQLVADMTLKLLGLDDSDIHGFPKIHTIPYFAGVKP